MKFELIGLEISTTKEDGSEEEITGVESLDSDAIKKYFGTEKIIYEAKNRFEFQSKFDKYGFITFNPPWVETKSNCQRLLNEDKRTIKELVTKESQFKFEFYYNNAHGKRVYGNLIYNFVFRMLNEKGEVCGNQVIIYAGQLSNNETFTKSVVLTKN